MSMTFYDPARAQSFTTPLPMGDRGKYVFNYKPTIKQNGRGDAIRAQYSNATWKWNWMYPSDFLWWTSTLVGLNGSLLCNGNTAIYVHTLQKTTSLVQCIVHQPTYANFGNGMYVDIEVKFSHVLLDIDV